jgi:hypothetical protein
VPRLSDVRPSSRLTRLCADLLPGIGTLYLGTGFSSVDSKAEEYRRKAEEAVQKAAESRDLDARRIWREAAQQWRGLAERAAREAK